MRRAAAITVILLGIAVPELASAEKIVWDITGGHAYAQRVGPGVMVAIGGNQCTRDYCDDFWDTHFFGSFAGTFGFFYRVIPNLSLFGELHFGYVNTDMNEDVFHDDRGFLFELTGGGEFHAPVTGWLDPYLGLGIGYAYLGGSAEYRLGGGELHQALHGFNFELRFGADFYPFSAVPTLSVGPMFRVGLAIWPRLCVEDDVGNIDECDDPGDFTVVEEDELPFLFHFGAAVKYGF